MKIFSFIFFIFLSVSCSNIKKVNRNLASIQIELDTEESSYSSQLSLLQRRQQPYKVFVISDVGEDGGSCYINMVQSELDNTTDKETHVLFAVNFRSYAQHENVIATLYKQAKEAHGYKTMLFVSDTPKSNFTAGSAFENVTFSIDKDLIETLDTKLTSFGKEKSGINPHLFVLSPENCSANG